MEIQDFQVLIEVMLTSRDLIKTFFQNLENVFKNYRSFNVLK